MLVELKNESGQKKTAHFTDMEMAAQWWVAEDPMAEYGCTLFPEEGEEAWDAAEWQRVVEANY